MKPLRWLGGGVVAGLALGQLLTGCGPYFGWCGGDCNDVPIAVGTYVLSDQATLPDGGAGAAGFGDDEEYSLEVQADRIVIERFLRNGHRYEVRYR